MGKAGRSEVKSHLPSDKGREQGSSRATGVPECWTPRISPGAHLSVLARGQSLPHKTDSVEQPGSQ